MSDSGPGTGLPSQPWTYPLSFGDTLATNDWIEWHIHRFLGSSFLSRMKYLDRRDVIAVAVELWTQAYLEDPAGTLPDDDVQLADKAGFGVDVERWRGLRDLALWGWSPVVIDDAGVLVHGRLGHRRIAAIAVESWKRKSGRATAREANRLAGIKFKVRSKLMAMGRKTFAENDRLTEEIARHLSTASLHVTEDNVAASLEALHGIPRIVSMKGGGPKG